MVRLAFTLLVLLHAGIHLLGFSKAMGWASPLEASISRPVGALWAGTALLFVGAAVLFALDVRAFWLLAAPAVVLSQTLIIFAWDEARYGTVANVVISIGALLALFASSPSSFPKVYQREVERRLSRKSVAEPVGSDDLSHLPPPVRQYLQVAGVVGRPRVRNFRARLRGEIRPSLEAGFIPFQAEQHNFYDPPARLFLIRSARFGLPFDALHLYLGNAATMQVKLASLFQVVDARGPEMNQSETVTLFNDMCVLAPATLIDRAIVWREIDARTAQGTFTNAGNTVSARLHFNDAGELTNFVSEDRYLSSDGKTYTKLRWSTPLGNYRDFAGARLASRGGASWRLSSGEFVYARMDIEDVEYNVERAPP
ncbi:MAG TPA: DUF6544 family protein [Polyangiaceae bacterium]|nr:DUF6544 family protein [Polyangiaceae bacterium]